MAEKIVHSSLNYPEKLVALKILTMLALLVGDPWEEKFWEPLSSMEFKFDYRNDSEFENLKGLYYIPPHKTTPV